MSALRHVLLVAGISVALLPCAPAMARGGRGGGGMGGGGMGGGGMGGGGMGGGGRGGGGGGGGGRGGSNSANSSGGGSTGDPKITADRQTITTDSTTLDKAKSDYNKAVKDFSDTFKQQDDYVAAKKAYDDAQKDFDTARAAMVKKLSTDDAEYKAATNKVAAARKKLDALHDSGASHDVISDQSKLIYDTDTTVSHMEDDAATTDPGCVAAKKKVDDAKAVLDALDSKLKDAIANDDNLKTLKQTMDTAQTALADAAKKLRTDQGN